MSTLSDILHKTGNAASVYGLRTYAVRGDEEHGYVLSIAIGNMRPFHSLTFKTYAEVEEYQEMALPARCLESWENNA